MRREILIGFLTGVALSLAVTLSIISTGYTPKAVVEEHYVPKATMEKEIKDLRKRDDELFTMLKTQQDWINTINRSVQAPGG